MFYALVYIGGPPGTVVRVTVDQLRAHNLAAAVPEAQERWGRNREASLLQVIEGLTDARYLARRYAKSRKAELILPSVVNNRR